MSKPSVQVLSEHFRQRMEGRRLLAAVFCTYQFDPGFFEQEVLPLFLGLQPHQNRKVRLVQLEEALREAEDLAVYYDVNGLQVGADGSAQLDVRRIPVRHPRGIFHPKLVFALVKELEGEREGEEVLLVAALSANMTRSGWWENVEACHVEEVRADEKLWMKPELLRHLRQLRRLAPAWEKHAAVDRVEGFLKRVPERRQRTQDGRLCTHFLDGSKPLAEALQEAAGDLVQGWDLEAIAPFFDQAETCRPLEALLEALHPARCA
ncbi:MAG: hypothetical protein H6590_08670 [Flavobacteriales bacterium]|nr:hypothetical protein [Flavobacteriales bacterium]